MEKANRNNTSDRIIKLKKVESEKKDEKTEKKVLFFLSPVAVKPNQPIHKKIKNSRLSLKGNKGISKQGNYSDIGIQSVKPTQNAYKTDLGPISKFKKIREDIYEISKEIDTIIATKSNTKINKQRSWITPPKGCRIIKQSFPDTDFRLSISMKNSYLKQ